MRYPLVSGPSDGSAQRPFLSSRRRKLQFNCASSRIVAPAKAGAQGRRLKSLGSRFRGNDERKFRRARTPISDNLERRRDRAFHLTNESEYQGSLANCLAIRPILRRGSQQAARHRLDLGERLAGAVTRGEAQAGQQKYAGRMVAAPSWVCIPMKHLGCTKQHLDPERDRRTGRRLVGEHAACRIFQ